MRDVGFVDGGRGGWVGFELVGRVFAAEIGIAARVTARGGEVRVVGELVRVQFVPFVVDEYEGLIECVLLAGFVGGLGVAGGGVGCGCAEVLKGLPLFFVELVIEVVVDGLLAFFAHERRLLRRHACLISLVVFLLCEKCVEYFDHSLHDWEARMEKVRHT